MARADRPPHPTPRRDPNTENWRMTLREVFALRRNGYSGPFWNGLGLFIVGFVLLLPTNTFETADSYNLMADIASELGWGVFAVGCSLFTIVASLQRHPREVSIGSLVAAFAWMGLFFSTMAANPEGLLGPICGVLWLRCLSLYREFREDFDPVTGNRWEPHV